jgi:MSHA pilin protein MshD
MNKTRCSGFTLIELIFFIVVVAIGMVGILKVMDVAVTSSADPMVRKQAVALADSVLEEVLLKAYADPDGTNVGETDRTNWDDVDDFNGKTQADFGPLPAQLAPYTFTVAVVVDATTLGLPAKKVTVTVTRGTEVVILAGYRTSY